MRSLVCCAALVSVYAGVPLPAGAQEPPVLKLTRELRIDATEQDLSPIGFLAVAPDGTIIVAQQQDFNLRYFDANGKSLGTFGRQGQGPGEFMRIGRVIRIADTLAVFDVGTRRLTLISPDRKLVRTVPLQVNVTMPANAGAESPRYSAAPMAMYGDGSFMVSVSVREGTPAPDWPGGTKEGTPHVRVDSSGVFRNVVAWRPAIDSDCSVNVGTTGFAMIPFCTTSLWELSPDGELLAVATVERVGDPAYRIAIFRHTGDTLFNRAYAYRPTEITKAAMDSAIAAVRMPGAGEALSKAALPRSYPPIARVVLGDDQAIWLEMRTAEGERTWLILDARGNPAGQVKVPRNTRIAVASRTTAWGTETDDDGLQHIVRFRVSR